MKTLARMLLDSAAATAAEYALIVAVVGTAIAGGALTLGQAVSDSMTGTGNCIEAGPNC